MRAKTETANDSLSVTFVSDWLTARSVTKCTFNLAKALAGRGHTVRVICPGGEMEGAFRAAGIDLETRGAMSMPVFNVFTLRAAAASVRSAGSRIIHVQSREAAAFGIRLASACRLPCVVTMHRFESSKRLAASKGTRILAVSEALREFLVNESKVSKERIDVVPNGVDLSEYKTAGPFAKPGQVPVVGSLGGLEPVRGVEYFVKAARTVVDTNHPVEFLAVGAGSEEKRLRELVSMLDLKEHFTFVTESADYNRRIESMDIVVVCPIREGFGMVALEAMACGRPVIASAVGGIYSLVKDGETGLLVPPKDPDGIAERIISLLGDTEEAERLGRGARAAVEENFTMDIVAEKTEMIYRRTIEG